MANPAFAFLTVTRFSPQADNPEQIIIGYQGVISDGAQQLEFANTFLYDNTLSQAVNLNNAKDALVVQAAELGYSLTRTNVKFNLQFN